MLNKEKDQLLMQLQEDSKLFAKSKIEQIKADAELKNFIE